MMESSVDKIPTTIPAAKETIGVWSTVWLDKLSPNVDSVTASDVDHEEYLVSLAVTLQWPWLPILISHHFVHSLF